MLSKIINNTHNYNNTPNINNMVKNQQQNIQSKQLKTNTYLNIFNQKTKYLNNIIHFNTGEYFYVTNRGVAKQILNSNIEKMLQYLNLTNDNIINIDIELNISTMDESLNPVIKIIDGLNEPLIIGDDITLGETIGNEGSFVKVNKMVSNNVKESFEKCYNLKSHFFDYTELPPKNLIKNGNFENPKISLNTHKNINSTIDNWNIFNAIVLNGISDKFGINSQYLNGNQCCIIKSTQNIEQIITLTKNITYNLTFDLCSSNNRIIKSNKINIIITDENNVQIENTTFKQPNITWESIKPIIFTPQQTQKYKISIQGTTSNKNALIAIRNIKCISNDTTENTPMVFEQCKTKAINEGYSYFGLTNTNISDGKGYCTLSKSINSNINESDNCSDINQNAKLTMVGGEKSVAIHKLNEVGNINDLNKTGYVNANSEMFETNINSPNAVNISSFEYNNYSKNSGSIKTDKYSLNYLLHLENKNKTTNTLNNEINKITNKYKNNNLKLKNKINNNNNFINDSLDEYDKTIQKQNNNQSTNSVKTNNILNDSITNVEYQRYYYLLLSTSTIIAIIFAIKTLSNK